MLRTVLALEAHRSGFSLPSRCQVYASIPLPVPDPSTIPRMMNDLVNDAIRANLLEVYPHMLEVEPPQTTEDG